MQSKQFDEELFANVKNSIGKEKLIIENHFILSHWKLEVNGLFGFFSQLHKCDLAVQGLENPIELEKLFDE